MKLSKAQLAALRRVEAAEDCVMPLHDTRRGEAVALRSLEAHGLIEAWRTPASAPHHYFLTENGKAQPR